MIADSRVERLTVAQGLRENTLKEAFVDREGNLWLGGISQGLGKLPDVHVVKFPIQDINPPYQYAIGAADRTNHLWVVARSGLWELWYGDDGSWHQAVHREMEGRGDAPPFPVFDIDMGSSKEVRPFSLFCRCDSTLWVVFSNGQIVSYAIHPSGHTPSRLEPRRILRTGVDVPREFPKSMIMDHRGLLWYSAGTEIFLLDPARDVPLLRRYREAPPGLGRNYARVLFEDRSGNIWAGFYTGGARRLAADSLLEGQFRRVPTPDGFSSDGVTAISQDSLGRVWVGTEERGALLYGAGLPERLSAPGGLASNTVLSVAVEPQGRIWIGSPLGISYSEQPGPRAVIQPSIFRGEYAVQAGVMPNGMLWFAGRSGVIIYDGKSDTSAAPAPKVCITSFQVNGAGREPGPEQSLAYDENTCTIGFVAPTFRDPALIRYQYRLRGIDTVWSAAQEQSGVTFAALPPGEYTFEVRTAVVGTAAPSEPTALQISIVPPFWKRSWFTVLAWLTLATVVGGTVRYFEKRKVLARLRALEVQQALDHERLRISQDMHDEVGSALSEIMMLSQLAQNKPEGTGTYIRDISERAAEVIDNVGEIVWAMNPRNDTLDNLIAHVRRHAVQYLNTAGLHC
ncbi:MAG TPA: two-component regulator propeller domain-containing protein, partial [Bacteroidota bacterium]